MLVDRLLGASSGCEYTADFTDTIVDTAGRFRLVFDDGVVVSAASASVAAAYESEGNVFSPEVSITVPDIDVDGNKDIHDLSGTTIRVSFRPVAGSNDACNSDRVFWEIRSNGSVGRLSSSRAVVLLDRPAGASNSCEYAANFADSVVDVGGALGLVSGDGVVVSAASASVAAVYENVGSTFSPDISITVPDIDVDGNGVHDFLGTTILVSFDPVGGSNDVCNSGSERWVVDDDGSVTRSSGAAGLVDSPQGVESRCQYDVAFEAVGAGGRWSGSGLCWAFYGFCCFGCCCCCLYEY